MFISYRWGFVSERNGEEMGRNGISYLFSALRNGDTWGGIG